MIIQKTKKWSGAQGRTVIACPVCWDITEAAVEKVNEDRTLVVPVIGAAVYAGTKFTHESVCVGCGVRVREEPPPPLLEEGDVDLGEAAERLRPELYDRFIDRVQEEQRVLDGMAGPVTRLRVLADRLGELEHSLAYYQHIGSDKIAMLPIFFVAFFVGVVGFLAYMWTGALWLMILMMVAIIGAGVGVIRYRVHQIQRKHEHLDPHRLAARSLAPFNPEQYELYKACRQAKREGAELSGLKPRKIAEHLGALYRAV